MSAKGLTVVLTGGGTGGHIYPALAVGEALQQDLDVARLVYIGKSAGLENQLVPAQGIEFQGIPFYGLPRKPGLAMLRWFWDLKIAVEKATRLLDQIRPDVVFGTGGYVSAPVLMAAKNKGIPYFIHEPDSHPGLANRFLARNAAGITAAFAASARILCPNPARADRFHVTGNPVRSALGRCTREEALETLALPPQAWTPNRPVLLVLGGSQGARTMNQAVARALPRLIDQLDLCILHQTGQKLYEETLDLLPHPYQQHPQYCIRPYFEDMAPLYALATLALCRAGSLSLSEMYLAGLPTILAPYPHAAGDHQRKNAQASVAAGASVMLADRDCSADSVTRLLEGLLHQRATLAGMKAAAQRLARPNATAEIVRLIKQRIVIPASL